MLVSVGDMHSAISQFQRRVSLTSNRFINEMNNMPLMSDHELPEHLREVAIMSGYRSPSSTLKECIQSAFVLTNETLNFWTHFISSLYFFWITRDYYEVLSVGTNPYTWPFMAYMLTICIYPLVSCLAHLFFSLSCFARDVWFFLDYGALSLYSFGAALISRAYCFPEELIETSYGEWFLTIGAANTIICTLLACWSRFMVDLFWIKVFRLGAFVIPWVWDSIPIIYRVMYPDSKLAEIDAVTLPYFLRQFFFSFCIGFFYASHLPERLAPGKFDIIGNSHNLLHISGIMATSQQLFATLNDLHTRRAFMEKGANMDHSFWSIYGLFGVFAFNLFFIVLFCAQSWKILNPPLESEIGPETKKTN